MSDGGSAARYRANLQGEVDSAGLYRALAESEADPRLSEVYRRLAAVEEAHAEFWRKQLARVGAQTGRLRPDWRSRALAWPSLSRVAEQSLAVGAFRSRIAGERVSWSFPRGSPMKRRTMCAGSFALSPQHGGHFGGG